MFVKVPGRLPARRGLCTNANGAVNPLVYTLTGYTGCGTLGSCLGSSSRGFGANGVVTNGCRGRRTRSRRSAPGARVPTGIRPEGSPDSGAPSSKYPVVTSLRESCATLHDARYIGCGGRDLHPHGVFGPWEATPPVSKTGASAGFATAALSWGGGDGFSPAPSLPRISHLAWDPPGNLSPRSVEPPLRHRCLGGGRARLGVPTFPARWPEPRRVSLGASGPR